MITAHRISSFISEPGAKMITDAADFSYRSGYPLNTFISVNCRLAGVEAFTHAFISDFVKSMGDFLRPFIGPHRTIWVLENPNDLNWHCLTHIPPSLHAEFKKRYRRWYALAKGRRRKGALHVSKPLQLQDSSDGRSNYLGHLTRMVLYMLKGAKPETCRAIGANHRPQGKIVGKRCHASESINWKARARYCPIIYQWRQWQFESYLRPLVLYGDGSGSSLEWSSKMNRPYQRNRD